MTTIYSKRHPKSKHEFVVMVIGALNRNGRMYTKPVVEEGLKNFLARGPQSSWGMFMDDANWLGQFSLEHISHKIENVEIRGDLLMATIVPMKTQKGAVLKRLLELDLVEFRTAGTYTHLDENNCVVGWTMTSVNVVAKGQGA